MKSTKRIIFLHHSTGETIWKGGDVGIFTKLKRKISGKSAVQDWFTKYNKVNKTNYLIEELAFPKKIPYGWNNYPYDYYNIWVKNAGETPYMEEPTLEILTKNFDVIIFKHCFPVGKFEPDSSSISIDSPTKTFSNYKLQYEALKKKLLSFPQTKFIIWTGAALTQKSITPEQAQKAKEWRNWIVNEWDNKNDNIFIWDFYTLETENNLYLKEEFASGPEDSHPNKNFCNIATPLFCKRVTNIIENRGDQTSLIGK